LELYIIICSGDVTKKNNMQWGDLILHVIVLPVHV
jgi:hypothetical protein